MSEEHARVRNGLAVLEHAHGDRSAVLEDERELRKIDIGPHLEELHVDAAARTGRLQHAVDDAVRRMRAAVDAEPAIGARLCASGLASRAATSRPGRSRPACGARRAPGPQS